MADIILVVNAGSSSIKFEAFAVEAGGALASRFAGQLEGIGVRPRLVAKDADGAVLVDRMLDPAEAPDVARSIAPIGAWLEERLGGAWPVAVGHRVVHGGPKYAAPLRIDGEKLAELQAFVPLAPLHQPNNLAPIRALLERSPDLPQVACFDTAFHRHHPAVADRYAIPEALYEEGIRRYGFHGLSYEYIASVLPERVPELAKGRVVVAHLGSGASMCAIKAGKSVDSTMGFTAVDGLPMGTRTGQLDPGVVLHLIQAKGWDAKRIERFLYHECGLKGLSGVSNDVRELLASDAPGARLAIDYFVYRIARETGALAAAMGGIDGFVFTAGIGENSAAIRARVCERLAWLGADLDAAANARHGPCITGEGARLPVWVVPTDEELMIARHTLALLRANI